LDLSTGTQERRRVKTVPEIESISDGLEMVAQDETTRDPQNNIETEKGEAEKSGEMHGTLDSTADQDMEAKTDAFDPKPEVGNEVEDPNPDLTNTSILTDSALKIKQGDSLLDLDTKLSDLEGALKGMLQTCPNNTSNSSPSSELAQTCRNRPSLTMIKMQARIDDMKQKLSQLEECFHSSQEEFELDGEDGHARWTPITSPLRSPSETNTSGTTDPLLATNPSGILRPSILKLKRNLSVRFATITEEEEEADEETPLMEEQLASRGAFDHPNRNRPVTN